MKNLKNTFCLLVICFSIQMVSAQEIAYGFKAGLNFNTFIADSELDAAGNELETFSNKTGFHVGATFTWKITDLMGLRWELIFSQKGGKYRYQGASFYEIPTDPQDILNPSERINTLGQRDMTVSVSNSYIDIPLVGYAKPVEWLEVHAGASIGFLISSTGFGSVIYDPDNATIDRFNYELDYRFISDEAGEYDFSTSTGQVQVGNSFFQLPRSAGAYFEYTEDSGNLYKIIDLGLLGGLSFYLNEGLYIGLRANYGLVDVTNTDADVSWQRKENGAFIKQTDNDRNLSLQASVGFSF